MDGRIDTLRLFIQYLRTTEPKHSFEILIFHVLLGVVCIIFSYLGEFWLWAITIILLYISLVIHYLRVRRAIKRQIQEELELVELMTLFAQMLSQYKAMRANTSRIELDAATHAEMQQMQDEIRQAQQERGF